MTPFQARCSLAWNGCALTEYFYTLEFLLTIARAIMAAILAVISPITQVEEAGTAGA